MPYFPVVVSLNNSPAMFAAFVIFQSTQHPPIIPIKISIETLCSRRRKAPAGKNFLERFLKMMIVDDSRFMKIDLSEHEISRENQAFRRMQSAFRYTEGGATAVHARNRLDRLYKTTPIKTAIIDPRMMRISEEIINTIRIHLAIYKITPKKRTPRLVTSFNKRNYCISRKFVVVICKMIVDNIGEIPTYYRCGIFFMRISSYISSIRIILLRKEFFAAV